MNEMLTSDLPIFVRLLCVDQVWKGFEKNCDGAIAIIVMKPLPRLIVMDVLK